MLQKMSSALDTDSSGEVSVDEEDKKEDIDEDDQAEQAKLPHYVNRFKVSVVFFSFFTVASGVRSDQNAHNFYFWSTRGDNFFFLSFFLFVSMLTARWQCCNIPFNIFRTKSNETGRH